MQRRIMTPGPLHDEKGHLTETGYATELLKTYDRSRVAASLNGIHRLRNPL